MDVIFPLPSLLSVFNLLKYQIPTVSTLHGECKHGHLMLQEVTEAQSTGNP